MQQHIYPQGGEAETQLVTGTCVFCVRRSPLNSLLEYLAVMVLREYSMQWSNVKKSKDYERWDIIERLESVDLSD
jgi:hypothetical protein